VTTDPSYPIGRFDPEAHWTTASRHAAIEQIAAVPANLRRVVSDLDDPQLDTPYRPGGWTVRQVVHHLADAQIHGYIRLKLALTQANPTIAPYDEEAWAELPDSRLPIEPSLAVVDGVTARWLALWHAAGEDAFARVYTHTESGVLTVEAHAHFFAWHARHHVAQISTLRERQGW
jgi:DinB superfamily